MLVGIKALMYIKELNQMLFKNKRRIEEVLHAIQEGRFAEISESQAVSKHPVVNKIIGLGMELKEGRKKISEMSRTKIRYFPGKSELKFSYLPRK